MGVLYLQFLLAFSFLCTPSWADTPVEWKQAEKEIFDIWRVRNEIVSSGKDPIGEQQLRQIASLKGKYGFTSIPTLSLSLLKEILLSPQEKELASQKITFAEKFSPNLLATERMYCKPGLLSGDFFPGVLRCLKSLPLEFSETEGQLRLLSNLFFVLLYSLFGVILAFGIFSLLRYLVPLSQQWGQHFPKVSSQGFLCFIGLGLGLAWLWGGGLALVCLWTLLVWRYFEFWEKCSLVFLLGLMALLPLAFYAPSLQYRYQQEVTPILERPFEGLAGEENASQLKAWIENHPKDFTSKFVLAQLEKQMGRMEQAKLLYRQISEQEPKWHKPLVNLAILLYGEDQKAETIQMLERASQVAPTEILPPFNLSKIYYEETRFKEGASALEKAKNIDPIQFANLNQTQKTGDSQKLLLEEKISSKDLQSRIWGLAPELTQIRNSFFATWFPMFSPLIFWILLGGTLLLAFFSQKIWPSGALPDFFQKKGRKFGHETLDIFDLGKSSPQEQENWVQKFLRNFQEKWCSLILPGSYLFFRSKPLSSIFYMGLSFLSITPLVLKPNLLGSIQTFPQIPSFPWAFLCIFFFALLYIFSLYRTLRG